MSGRCLQSLPPGYNAVVTGSTGTIGAAVANTLESDERCGRVIRMSRSSTPALDVTDERSVAAAFESLGETKIHLLFDATGVLDIGGKGPEKSLRDIDVDRIIDAFRVNTVGPALLLKHVESRLPREQRSIVATLSARVGSIGDNGLGGWYGYRASKAALNQIVRTAAIELARRHPDNVCVALHPGTVKSDLSKSYAKGRFTFSDTECADRLLEVLDGLAPAQTGRFFAYDGSEIPW